MVSNGRQFVAILVNQEYCKGCNLCIEFCKLDVLKASDTINMRGYYPPYPENSEECIGCRFCELLCPEFAIYIINE